MSHYEDKPEDLTQDTKEFAKSDYGQHLITTLEEKAEGYLAEADNMNSPYPERFLAKHSAIKEVLNLINGPLEDDKLSRG